jgi:hypothetical protein
MPYVMRYETWMNLTDISFKIRSKYLRRVDKALKQYEQMGSQPNLQKLKIALHQWKMSKGFDTIGGKPAWMRDERNRRQAIQTLDLQVYDLPSGGSKEVLADLAELPFYGIEAWAGEEMARQAMKQAREESLVKMFTGTQVTGKKVAMGYAIDSIKRHLDTAKSDGAAMAKEPAKAAASYAAKPVMAELQRQAVAMIQEVLGSYPIDVAKEVMALLTNTIPEFMTELASSMAPYVSLVKSGGQAFYATARAIQAEYQWVKAEDHLDSFDHGDPYAAVVAVQRMIERKRNQYARLGGIYATDTAIRAGAVLDDAAAHGAPVGSMVIGSVAAFGKAIALLALEIFLVGRDYYEKYKVNKVLTDPSGDKLSKAILDTCPLLGCYYVAGATTSDIINFAVGDIGGTGWKLDVEVMVKKHVTPMIGYAREAISSSRLEVEGLERSKAAVNDTTAGKWGLSNPKNRLKKKMIAKLSTALPFVDDPNDYEQVAKKQGNQVVSRDVLKGRISGQGHRTV